MVQRFIEVVFLIILERHTFEQLILSRFIFAIVQ